MIGNGHSAPGAALPVGVKTLITGGFGVGKTTMVGAVSEVLSLITEEHLPGPGSGPGELAGAEVTDTSTVTLDVGRITVNPELVLYLFGVPGQDRSWFVWDELTAGALGAVVLADHQRLPESLPSVDYFEQRGLPFIVAVNAFDDLHGYDPVDVRAALALDPSVPVVRCDPRRRESVKQVLISLVEHVLRLRTG